MASSNGINKILIKLQPKHSRTGPFPLHLFLSAVGLKHDATCKPFFSVVAEAERLRVCMTEVTGTSD